MQVMDLKQPPRAKCDETRLWSKLLERLRQEECWSPGIWGQPGLHNNEISLLKKHKTIWMPLLGLMWDLGCWAAPCWLSSHWIFLQWSELMRMLEWQTLKARLHPPFPLLTKKEKNKMLPSVG